MDAVAEGSKGRVSRDCIGLVTSRAAVGELLKLDHLIDLVIPRGSGALVNHIKVIRCCAVVVVVVVQQPLRECGRERDVETISSWWLLGCNLFFGVVTVGLCPWC